MTPRLILRADGNERIGLGHVMRLLALAEIAGEEFDRVFVVRAGLPGTTHTELADATIKVVEMPKLLGCANISCAPRMSFCLMGMISTSPTSSSFGRLRARSCT